MVQSKSSTVPHLTRWGIVGTGWISTKFVLDLLVDPNTRGVHDVEHRVEAVASRSLIKAEQFVQDVWDQGGTRVSTTSRRPRTYGSYQQLIDDPVCSLYHLPSGYWNQFGDFL